MKYYHTPTREDYDDLMSFLEERGFSWFSGDNPTDLDEWDDHKEDTTISIYEQSKEIGFTCKSKLPDRGTEESDIIVWGNEEAKDYLERLINEEEREKEESNV